MNEIGEDILRILWRRSIEAETMWLVLSEISPCRCTPKSELRMMVLETENMVKKAN